MAEQILLSVSYLIPRLLLWVALFAAAGVDGYLHRTVRARGWQLHRAVVVVIAAFVIQDCLLLAFASENTTSADNVYRSFIFFTDLADSLFIGLLLTIAAGFCITRDTLGPYKKKVVVIPITYFCTSLVVDYVITDVRGRSDFQSADDNEIAADKISELQSLLLLICAVVNLMALLLAWVYIFDTISKEREELESWKPRHALETVVVQAPSTVPAGQRTNGQGQEGVGVPVEPPADALITANDSHLPNLYSTVEGQDADEPKDVQQSLVNVTKIRLMKQFSIGVAAYVIATAAVFLMPLFINVQAAQVAVKCVIIGQNLVLWGFLAGLCYIFRVREGSPYLLLEDDGPDSSSPRQELNTELGVMSSTPRHDNVQGKGDGTPVGLDTNFSITDDDDGQELTNGLQRPNR